MFGTLFNTLKSGFTTILTTIINTCKRTFEDNFGSCFALQDDASDFTIKGATILKRPQLPASQWKAIRRMSSLSLASLVFAEQPLLGRTMPSPFTSQLACPLYNFNLEMGVVDIRVPILPASLFTDFQIDNCSERQIKHDNQEAAKYKAIIKEMEATIAQQGKQIKVLQRREEMKERGLRNLIMNLIENMNETTEENAPVVKDFVNFVETYAFKDIVGEIDEDGCNQKEYAIAFVERACAFLSLEDLEEMYQNTHAYYTALDNKKDDNLTNLISNYANKLFSCIEKEEMWLSHPLYVEVQQKRKGLKSVILHEIARLLSASSEY